MGRKESIFENHLAEAILKSSDSSELSSPNYPGSLQGSEYGSSDDDAGDYPYRNDGEDGTQVVITRTNPSAKKDPGPSVRVRTAAELDAVIKAQVEDGEYHIHSFFFSKALAFANRLVTKLPSPA